MVRTKWTWALFLAVALAAPAAGQTAKDFIAQADALFSQLWTTQYVESEASALRALLERAIALYEKALAQEGANAYVLSMLSRCHYMLADIFLPEKEKADAHAKGQEYGERALRTDPEFVRVEREKGFVEAVKVSPDIAACFWTYSNWARKIELGGAVGLLSAALRGDDKKLMALMERCLELERGYISGGPLRALAGYWAKHPFSKDPAKVKAFLDEAIATFPDYLENRLFYVEYYLLPAERWAEARAELQKIIDAPVGRDALENGYVKVRAVVLLGQIGGK
ncbi:MAG: TRAP transporter TatT component family protein [Candidatus Bipolaricaulota bacterium]|nr:TRAP transporter TatT component family protein [Candidatus Bipolaricaulota bacterium]